MYLVSSKTIKAFEAFTRNSAQLVAPRVDVTGCAPRRESKREARTEPAPASVDLSDDLNAAAAEQEAIGHGCLARAIELRAAAKAARRIMGRK